jgi:S-adenosyl-L-methionine hydrolase (adenosine-forming)
LARTPGDRPRLVTLTSDLGAAYAAQVKAVLSHHLPPGRIVDLAHDLPPHAIAEAAFLVRAMARGFPAGTVHMVVVDPGVGGHRAPIVIDCSDGSRLVGPDNGVLYPLSQDLGLRRAYRIDPARLGGSPRVGTTFDGRDVFAPAAARLARGSAPSALGPPVTPRRYSVPVAEATRTGARGEVLHVDRFGNVITNIPTAWVPAPCHDLVATVGPEHSRRIPWVTSYEELGSGRLGAIGSSFGSVELAVGQGRAADRWKTRVGDRVRLRWAREPRDRVIR